MNAPVTIVRENEATAKAALLNHLLATGQIARKTAIVLELSIAKQANRADLVTIDDQIHCYEIKTKRDNLHRLDQQISSYQAVSHRVTVVAASKHVNAILSRTPSHIGIMEMLEYDGEIELRIVRAASISPFWLPAAVLDLLPVTEIRSRLLSGKNKASRNELVLDAAVLPSEIVHLAVVGFLRDRYLPTTRKFLKSLRRKPVAICHLNALRVWGKEPKPESNFFQETRASQKNGCSDQATYEYVGLSFGPVPDDVHELLISSQPIPLLREYIPRR